MVNSLFPPHGGGGAERSVAELAAGLAAAGHQVHVLALGPEGGESLPSPDGITVKRWDTGRFEAFVEGEDRSALTKLAWHAADARPRGASTFLRRATRKFRPDVVHTNNLAGFGLRTWSAFPGVPLVHTIRDYYLLCVRSEMFRDGQQCQERCLPCRTLRAPLRLPGRRPDLVVGVSAAVLVPHRSMLEGVPTAVVHNDPALVPRARTASAAVRFGFLGRLNDGKGLWVAVEAFRQLVGADLRLEVGGSGDPAEVARLQAVCEGDPRIAYRGRVEAAEFLSGVDCLLVPTQWAEPYGRVAAEGLAAGCRVLVSAVGGLPEILQERGSGAGRSVDRFTDPAAWADQMRAVVAEGAGERARTGGSGAGEGAVPGVGNGAGVSREMWGPNVSERYLEVYEQARALHRG